MLEDFISPAAAQWLRSSILSDHVEPFCAQLDDLGYRPSTIRDKLWTVSILARWLAERRASLTALDERCVGEFLDARRSHGRTCRGVRATACMLLAQLRSAGAIPMPAPTRDDSPIASLLSPYEAYLRQERALTEGTISAYVSIAGTFVRERLPEAGTRFDALGAADVHDFLLARVDRTAPKRAQYIGSALRSFLRFLFMHGETGTDLARAVLTVRRWHLSTVPRYMAPGDVERLLRSCDRTSITGRRNHAVLLLLARLGLRASEVAALELGDVRWRDGELIVRGKGLVRDRLPLLPDVGAALALYVTQDRPYVASRRVFLCRRAPHRGFGHPSTVTTIVTRALVRAGLTPATRGAHLLRHSLATAMVRRGASLTEIGQVLRHRSPNTTELYAKLDFGALRDIALPWPTPQGAR